MKTSFKVTRIVVGRGETLGNEEAQQWTRSYYEVEAVIADERDLQQAKAALECLLDGWLHASEPTQLGKSAQSPTKDLARLPYNVDAIPWIDKTNEKGPFQLCDIETNADLVALRAFTLEHAGGGISTKDNQGVLWYVWVFPDSKTVGRRKSQFVKRRR